MPLAAFSRITLWLSRSIGRLVPGWPAAARLIAEPPLRSTLCAVACLTVALPIRSGVLADVTHDTAAGVC